MLAGRRHRHPSVLSWGRLTDSAVCDLVACSSDVARWSGTCCAPTCLPDCRSPRSVKIETHAPGWIPSRVPHVLPAGRSLTGADSPEVPRPFDDTTRASPTCAGPSGSDAVPLPGVLSLSAVSWHARARDPLGPQPSLGSSPPEPSPRGDRDLSRGRLLPCSQSPTFASAMRAPCHRRFHPLPQRSTPREVSHRSRLAPPSAMSSLFPRLVHDLSAVRLRASRSPWTLAPGSLAPVSSTCFEALIPPSSPFTRRTGLPIPRGRCSPGVRPSRALLRPDPGPYVTRVRPRWAPDALDLACELDAPASPTPATSTLAFRLAALAGWGSPDR